MKKLISITITIVVACFLFSACHETLTDAKIQEIQNEIIEISDLTLRYFMDRDTANAYKFYSDDFTLLSEGLYKMKAGDLKDFIPNAKLIVATRDNVIYEIIESRVEVLSANVANHYFTYSRKIVFGDEITFESPVACTWTFVKEKEGWKIRSGNISYPMEHYRAKENDNVWVLINSVKTEKKDVFEEFMHEVFFDKAPEKEDLQKFLVSKTRILHPVEDNADGTSTYIFIMDPLMKGANYDIWSLLVQRYGEEKATEYMKMWTESVAVPQKGFMMVQSRH